MWRLICNPPGYHSLYILLLLETVVLVLINVAIFTEVQGRGKRMGDNNPSLIALQN